MGIEIYVPKNILFSVSFPVLDVLYVVIFISVCYLFSPIRCTAILNVLGLGEFSIISNQFYSQNWNSLTVASPSNEIHKFTNDIYEKMFLVQRGIV